MPTPTPSEVPEHNRYSYVDETGAERYLSGRLSDPEYREAYEDARTEIEGTDEQNRAFKEKLAHWREHGAPAYHGPRAGKE